MTLYEISYYGCLACIVLGLVLGLMAIWVDGFRDSATAGKLAVTDGMLFVTALAVTIITKLLG